MQRKQEIFPTLFAETPEMPANTGYSDIALPGALPPETEFVSFHYLLKRATDLGEVPAGFIQVRDKNGILQGVRTDKIPSHRMVDLVEQIAQGRVYVYWAQHVERMDELGPEWRLACGKKYGMGATRRLRSTRRAKPRVPVTPPRVRAPLPLDG